MLFLALLLVVWTLCLDLVVLHLISHFFTCFHVLISSSSLLIDFLSCCSSFFHLRVALCLHDSVSSECQSHHRATFLMSVECVTLCHQMSFVLLFVNVRKICQFFSPLYLAHSCTSAPYVSFSMSSLGCPCFCRLTINLGNENYFMTHLLQKMFRHHPFGNTSRQNLLILLQQKSKLRFAVFVTTLCVLHDPIAKLRHLCCSIFCMSSPIAVCIHVQEH